MNLKSIALIIIVTALSGCATNQKISLTKQVQANLDRVEGVLTISQKNLYVTVPATNPGNTGLLGVLIFAAIDVARESSAEQTAAPILAALGDYDFKQAMVDASNDALSKVDKVKISTPLRVETVSSDSAKRIAFDQSTASAVLFSGVSYRLESGNLIVNAIVEMYPKRDALKQFRTKPEESDPLDAGNAIYRKIFSFGSQAVNAATIKAQLSEAATNIANQLAADLNHGI